RFSRDWSSDVCSSDLVVTGDLTIRGVTQSVELATDYLGTDTDPFGNVKAGFEATTEIDREAFGLTWNAALESGGVLVGRKVQIRSEERRVGERSRLEE